MLGTHNCNIPGRRLRFLTTGAKFLAGMRSAPTFLGVGLFWPGRGCALAGATAPKATPAAPVCPTIDCQPEPRSVLKQTTSGCCTIRLRMNETEIKPGRELTSEGHVTAGHLSRHAQAHLRSTAEHTQVQLRHGRVPTGHHSQNRAHVAEKVPCPVNIVPGIVKEHVRGRRGRRRRQSRQRRQRRRSERA